jgi:hypothetical protein
MKVSREILEASDQRLTEECNRHDQDGEEKKGKEDGCQSASAPEQLLQPAVCGVASNSNGQSPSDHGDEGPQNEEAGGGKQDDKGEVNETSRARLRCDLSGAGWLEVTSVSPSQTTTAYFDQLIIQAQKTIFWYCLQEMSRLRASVMSRYVDC